MTEANSGLRSGAEQGEEILPDARRVVHVQSPPILWLWFGLLVLLPVVGGLISFSRLRRLNVRVAHTIGAQEWQTRTILGLARTIRLTERAALAYAHTRDAAHVVELERCRKEFDAISRTFPSLEGTFSSTRVATDLGDRHRLILATTVGLLEEVERRDAARRRIRTEYAALHSMLDSPAALAVSRGAGAARTDAVAQLAGSASATLGGLDDRVLSGALSLDEAFLLESRRAFGRFEDLLTSESLDESEVEWLDKVRSTYDGALVAAQDLGRSHESVTTHLEQLADGVDELGAYLVNELQPRLVQQAVEVRNEIEQARRTAGGYLAGFCLLGILAGTGVAFALSKKTIILPATGEADEAVRRQLSEAGVHVEAGRGLEPLGHAFDQMVKNVAQSEGQLRDKEERLRMILENAADGMVTINQHGAIESFNAKAKEMFGYREVEVLGKNVKLLMPDPQHAEHDGHLERFLRTREARILGQVREVPGLRKSGETFPMELVVSESRVGKRVTYTGIVRDITERKEAEARRARLIRELETKNAEMERFSYTVSHDLKSPLITIRGFLGLLEKDLEAGDAKRVAGDLGHIRGAVTSMQSLLTELLELSRVGRIVNPPQAAPLTAIVRDAVELVAGPLAVRGVEVTVAADMPWVLVDRPRLVETFQNLVENAVKFMGDQENPCLDITTDERDGRVTCAVRDNGIGIDPRYHDRVFGLFERLDQGGEGTGIGLALVKRIVELHDGRIWVESDGVGHGSTIFVELPVCKEAAVASA